MPPFQQGSPYQQQPMEQMPPFQQGPAYQQQPMEQMPPFQTPPPLQPVATPPVVQKKNKRSSLYIGLAALLALIIIGGLVGTLIINNHNNTAPTTPTTTTNTGNHVFFQDGTLRSDQLHIDMQNIAAPPDGQTYFAWLQTTDNQSQPLGPLTVQDGGIISFTYPGDSKHTNLISITQGVLITTENAGTTPQTPGTKVYQAQFDQQLVNGLRNLLVSTPGLPDQQSVVTKIYATMLDIDDKAGSIVDNLSQDNGLTTRQATRILESLETTKQAQSSGDLPANDTPQLGLTIGLLSTPAQQGYLDILDAQLKNLEPMLTNHPAAQQHLTNVTSAINDLRTWLQKMHDDDVQILKATSLKDPAIVNTAQELRQLSADALNGHIIPPNSSPQPAPGSAGAIQAYTKCQYMTELDLKPV